MSSIKNINDKQTKSDFDKKVLAAIQHLHPFVKHRLYIAESTIGSAVPSALLFGDEMIQNQLDQNLPYKAAFFTGTLLSFIEGYSERMFPNEMNFENF